MDCRFKNLAFVDLFHLTEMFFDFKCKFNFCKYLSENFKLWTDKLLVGGNVNLYFMYSLLVFWGIFSMKTHYGVCTFREGGQGWGSLVSLKGAI